MTSTEEWLRIESLDLEAQGVAHNAEGKVVFVEDALPGEEVQVAVRRRKNNWEQASLVALRRESAQRVVPRCPHFGVCGGCKMQHLHVAAQVATKQRALEDALWHLGKVAARAGAAADRRAGLGLPAAGAALGAPRRQEGHGAGRLPRAQVELRRRHPTAATSCRAHVSDLLLPLRELVGAMRARDRLPQIELAVGDDVDGAGAAPPRAADRGRPRRGCARFARDARRRSGGCSPRGRTPRIRSTARRRRSTIALPEFGITMPFRPTDFTQVNRDINRVLVSRALRLLDAAAATSA